MFPLIYKRLHSDRRPTIVVVRVSELVLPEGRSVPHWAAGHSSDEALSNAAITRWPLLTFHSPWHNASNRFIAVWYQDLVAQFGPEPGTRKRDELAKGANPTERVSKPIPGMRCPRCHAPAGSKPCSLCNPGEVPNATAYAQRPMQCLDPAAINARVEEIRDQLRLDLATNLQRNNDIRTHPSGKVDDLKKATLDPAERDAWSRELRRLQNAQRDKERRTIYVQPEYEDWE